jgi:hypothetical protein
VVIWNPDAPEDSTPLDDRYTNVTSRYRIPFLFAPGYELPVEPSKVEPVEAAATADLPQSATSGVE